MLLTMPGAQCSEMIRYRIQIIPVRRELAPRVVRRKLRYAASTRRERRRHVVRQVQALQRELDEGLDLVREWALGGEALQMNEKNWG